jgi:tetratricopeptide (TPR) repeat protein
METVNHNKTRISGNLVIRIKMVVGFVLFLLILSAPRLFSQNYPVLQDAFARSYDFESKKKYTEALAVLKNINQDTYEINLRSGWVAYLAGLYTESLSYYQRAIKQKPYAIEAKLGSVNPMGALGNWDQVIAQYNTILSIDPQNTYANYHLGQIYYVRKDYLKAARYLEKVINLYPFDYDSMLLYAWINFKMGKLREAQLLFNKVLMNRPKDPSALEGLSMIK